jgi:4'-phosphopantetheinyl transferase
LSLSLDICRRTHQPFAFQPEVIAEATGARTHLQRNGDIEIHFAFAKDFPTLLRDEDILDEQDWADISRQRNRELRRRAIATRVLLRKSLSELFDGKVQPSQWRFVRTSYGKLVTADGLPQVHFSISHTRDASVIAISKFRLVGIDIEALGSEVDNEALETGLSRREQILVGRLDPCNRSKASLKLWTLKEAYTKLIGIGLSAHLPSYEFLSDPALPGQYCGTEEHARETRFETWFMESGHGTICVSVARSNHIQ